RVRTSPILRASDVACRCGKRACLTDGTQQFVKGGGDRRARGDDLPERTQQKISAYLRFNGFGYQNVGSKALVQALDAGGEIYRCAERRVLHPLRRADIADNGVPV